MDPSESEREGEEITIIKHLIFPMADSVAFIRPPPPVSTCILFFFSLSLYFSLSVFPISVSSPLCVKNKGRGPAGDERAVEGQCDIWVWYFHCRPKCLVSTNLLAGNQREKD